MTVRRAAELASTIDCGVVATSAQAWTDDEVGESEVDRYLLGKSYLDCNEFDRSVM